MDKSKFTAKLLQWHAKNKRDLPWKKTRDPYKIWLSEIILQQTRVEQGTPYYKKMVRLFPSVKKLAMASEDDVLRAWEGLGYYTRARNLHMAAKQIMDGLNGKFPEQYDDIIKLKGVGTYTASAIASFAFNLPHAVVDGNVYRVLSRVFGIKDDIRSPSAKKKFSQLAHEILYKKDSASFNQAMMDFGSIVCTPSNPKCQSCFFRMSCYAFQHEMASILPVNKKKQKIRTRWFNFLVFENDDMVIIEKRTGDDIWKGLYQFPLIETSSFQKADEVVQSLVESKIFLRRNSVVSGVTAIVEHKLSHQTIMARFIQIEINFCQLKMKADWKESKKSELNKFGFPKLIVNYYKKYVH